MSTTHSDTAFRDAVATLNTEQRRAVDTIEGPVLVVAGPGTGKTQILTLRIANILKQTDTAPEQILALTFTDSGAQAMRQRLRKYIGNQAYRVPIYTFHGFAEQLIRNYPDAYERVVGGTPLTDLEALRYLESIIDSGICTHLRPVGNPRYYVKPVRDQISAMKREYITPERLAELLTKETAALEEMPRGGFLRFNCLSGTLANSAAAKIRSSAKSAAA
jgi:DNA helicase-2/ATP-dependent DNA helicase PcrA